LLQGIHIHPAIVILLFLGYGAFHLRTVAALQRRKQQKQLRSAQQKEGVTRGLD
jgi:chromate transporter